MARITFKNSKTPEEYAMRGHKIIDFFLSLVFRDFTLRKFYLALMATKDRKIFVDFDKVRDWAFIEIPLPRDHRFYCWCLNFGGHFAIFCDSPQRRGESPTEQERKDLQKMNWYD